MGVAGSGKTTLARQILRRIAAVYLDNNHVADAFFPDSRNGASYNKLRPGFYKALYTIAEENLQVGNSVVLDVPHVKEMQREAWRAAIRQCVRKTKAKLITVRCLSSEKAIRERLITRAERRDRWKLRHWNEFLEEQPINVHIPCPHLDINTEQPLPKNTSAALRYILAEAKGKAQSGQRREAKV
jgi:predicted kinase